MSWLGRLGLRTRLAIALVGVAVLTVAISTFVSNRGLQPLVNDAAEARLHRSAEHMAEVAAAVYQDQGSWNASARETLIHLAHIDNLRIGVRSNEAAFGSSLQGARAESAPVVVDGETVATIKVAQDGTGLLTPEEQHLQHSLDRLHLIAGAVSVLVALLLGFLLAETLSRPLRRIRRAADQIAEGELDTRVPPIADPEVGAVGQSLNALASTLEQEEEIRKRTVADLAHELRTPVNGLLTRIEAAQDGVLEGPENLEAMHEEALRLTRLLDDLSLLADAEQPGLLLEKRDLDLAAVVEASVVSFAPRFDEAGITRETHLDPVWIDGNWERLEQVVSNLLSNALRYTPAGGTVTVAVRRDGRSAELTVSDTGPGIPEGDLPHVFTRFWRGDASRSTKTGGTGIGLSIVRGLVRAHDGRVWVESVVGEGTVFGVTFPAVDRPAVPVPAAVHAHR